MIFPPQVNNNGGITFERPRPRPLIQFTPQEFPLRSELDDELVQLIAPYWSDVDTRDGGGSERLVMKKNL